MDYEKKYKEALERAKNINNEHRAQSFDVMTRVFPELKESKDEKIRKEIISALKFANVKGVYDKHIAWLEKQYEKKSTNKVEPKFKTGDWIAHDAANFVFQVVEIGTCGYTVVNREDYTKIVPFSNEGNYNLWTIKDAKDGDVLQLGKVTAIFKEFISVDNCKCYCSVYNEEFEIRADNTYGCYNAVPSSKGQRETLFKAMHEAGYAWDVENKELKKIEFKSDDLIDMVTEKSVWGEDGEQWRQKAIDFMKHPDLIKATPTLAKNTIDWIKSLKDRVKPQWKPSEEHIRYLQAVVNDVHNIGSESCCIALRDLLEQLKKL